MRRKRRPLHLFLALGLGLVFIGCVGVPQRRPPQDVPDLPPAPRQPVAQAEPEIPTLRIPAEPPPARDGRVTPVSASEPSPRPAPPTQPPPRPTREAPPPPSPDDPPPMAPPLPSPKPAPVPPSPPPTVPPAPPANPLPTLRQLQQAAAREYATHPSYIVRLTRREFFNGKHQPEEVVLFKFRKEPFSVYLKWIGTVNKGREVIYVKGKHGGKIHTQLAPGEMPLMPRHIALDPNSGLVRNSSRHAITEAGVGTLIEHFGAVLDALEKGDTSKGTLTYLGPQKRPEFTGPLDAIEWKLPPGVDPTLPRGGRRWCFLDRQRPLPVLIITHDERGQEVEYYRYDVFNFVALDDEDFNPDRFGGARKKPAP